MEDDTVKLLRECDAGVKMAIDSISDVQNNIESGELKRLLTESASRHAKLSGEIEAALASHGEPEKAPSIMATGMSKLKTNFQIGINDSDATIAALMTDGCDMGIKSLSRYLNQYSAADEQSKAICSSLIKLEDRLCTELRAYL